MQTMVRPATIDDLPAILAIYNDAVLHTTASYDEAPSTLEQRAAWFHERVRHELPVLVADWAGRVVGFGSFGPFREKVGYRYTVEHSVYVDAGYHRRGVGRALLAALIEAARARELHAIIAVVDAENDASIGLHASLGFVEVAHLHQVGYKFGRWLDLIYLELLLGHAAIAEADAAQAMPAAHF